MGGRRPDPSSGSPGDRPRPRFRITRGTGLQGTLVLCFMFLLTAALAASCWVFASESREAVDRMAGEQAGQLVRALAMASEPPLERGDAAELQRIGAELMKTKGLVAVAFFDAAGRRLAVAARDPDLERPEVNYFANPREGTTGGPRAGWTAALGRFAELTAPVTRIRAGDGPRPVGQVVGYLTVCVSQADADARARNATLLVVLVGAVAVLVSLPGMYLLVHRVFAPIRQLVAAADRIAAGDLGARVASADRPDLIGTLARSFNEMVTRVRAQREALAVANVRLEDANGHLAEANRQLAEANEQLAGANRGLEEKVRRRTAELERANARLSAEMADKDEFLRTVSHDLNAPLRNIAGMAAMLLVKHRAAFDADVVHRLERIQKNVELETGLIGELLELSRIKTRRQKFEPVPLGEVVREAAELVAQDLETRGIAFVVDTPLPTLVCERARLRQVFQNLVDNAVKYMGDGSPPAALAAAGHPVPDPAADRVRAVHVGCRTAGGGPGADGPELEFYVRDTGIGIDAAELGNVFRVFRRGKSQAVQAVAGKGVGLASVKSIVETYGGTIRVDSTVGAGSTFRFTIDRKHEAAAGEPAVGNRAA